MGSEMCIRDSLGVPRLGVGVGAASAKIPDSLSSNADTNGLCSLADPSDASAPHEHVKMTA